MSPKSIPSVGNPTGVLIARLVEDLEPVRPMRFSSGLAFALAGLAMTMAMVAALFGARADVLSGRFDPVFLLATGLFLLLGLASATTVVKMSRPQVGSDHGGWGWAVAMATLLPIAAVFAGLGRRATAFTASDARQGLDCFKFGSGFAVITFGVLIWWLRRGAPTSPQRAGLLTGIAAGSFGIGAFSLHCAQNDIVHIGLWHGATVLAAALMGRFAVPPLIRW